MTKHPSVITIHQLLPQTQCRRCGFDDCLSYAQALAADSTSLNRCPPGGSALIGKLAKLLDKEPLPLDSECGTEGPLLLATIDPNWCIGCTLCLPACPTDAILGSNRKMHTILEDWCTGCELCVPVCPVDCIQMKPSSPPRFMNTQSSKEALERYTFHQFRAPLDDPDNQGRLIQRAQEKPAHLEELTHHHAPAELERKRSIIKEALAKAKQ